MSLNYVLQVERFVVKFVVSIDKISLCVGVG